eukprot:s218_g31.t1
MWDCNGEIAARLLNHEVHYWVLVLVQTLCNPRIGLCTVAPRGLPYSVLHLGNTCAAHQMFSHTVKDFSRLYNRKAHVHHYTEYMEKGEFDEAFETVNALIKDYIHLDMHETPASCCPRPTAQSLRSAAAVLTPSTWASSAAAGASSQSIPSIRFDLDTIDGGIFSVILGPDDYAEVKGSDCAFAFQPVDLPPNLGPMWVFGQTALRNGCRISKSIAALRDVDLEPWLLRRKYYTIYDAKKWHVGIGQVDLKLSEI